jgi:hypothetical protein
MYSDGGRRGDGGGDGGGGGNDDTDNKQDGATVGALDLAQLLLLSKSPVSSEKMSPPTSDSDGGDSSGDVSSGISSSGGSNSGGAGGWDLDTNALHFKEAAVLASLLHLAQTPDERQKLTDTAHRFLSSFTPLPSPVQLPPSPASTALPTSLSTSTPNAKNDDGGEKGDGEVVAAEEKVAPVAPPPPVAMRAVFKFGLPLRGFWSHRSHR